MLVNIKELKNALDKLIKACEKTNYDDADSFLFNEKGIFAHNAISFVQVPFQNIGTFSIKASQFLKFITALNVDEADFDFNQKDCVLSVKEGKKKVKFSVRDTVPPLGEFIKEYQEIKVTHELVDAIKVVAQTSFLGTPITATEELATFVHIVKDHVESTNLSQACRVTVPGLDIANSVLIKGKDFLRIAPQGISALEFNDTWTYLKDAEGVTYGFRTVDIDNYPNMDVYFSIELKDCVAISFDETVLGVIERVASVYNHTFDGVYPSQFLYRYRLPL